MSFSCPHCTKGEPLYRCRTCGATAHINKEKKELVIHVPPLKLSKQFHPRTTISVSFPSHFDCELAKPINKIDIKKLILVEAKK